MKYRHKFFCVAFAGFAFVAQSCNKQLVEEPKTVFSVEYFKTPDGFQNGINALYSGMRFLYGPEGAVSVNTSGTDEFGMGSETRRGAANDLTTFCNYTLDNTGGSILTPWNRSFNNINLANNLVDVAGGVAISDAARTTAVGEIRFLRGLYYFNLVQQFGAVPLDLGAGELKFNQNPFRGFNRLPVADVFVKNYQAIIADFTAATQSLPDQRPTGAFRLSKAAAFHMLAKAYLFRSYSAAKQATDVASAYTAATEIINNQAKYGTALQTNFADVNRAGNDYNSEILLSIERIPGNFGADEVGDPPNTIGGGKGVDAANDFCGDYTSISAPLITSSTRPVNTRTVTYGRPIRRFAPTPWLFNTAFADKVNDSRYEGSFRTTYITSVTGGGYMADVDTGFIMALSNRIADSLNGIAPAGPRLKAYRVVAPREFYFTGGTLDASTANMYPSLSKYEDPGKLLANNPGSRPFPAAKLSETYLIAAEAAMISGNTSMAVSLINAIRERAAYRTNISATVLATRKAAMDITTAQLNLDFLLDEHTRELCGESLRWADLSARGKLIERVKLYNTDAAANITPNKHELRPIPKDQLDRTEDPDKGRYQNPGY